MIYFKTFQNEKCNVIALIEVAIHTIELSMEYLEILFHTLSHSNYRNYIFNVGKFQLNILDFF